MQKLLNAGRLAGAATLAWRYGRAQSVCVGWRDKESKLPVEQDTIFRVASMTKPITSVAALILIEQGKIGLTDPIFRYAPEFSRMRVLRSIDGALQDTVPAEREITIR